MIYGALAFSVIFIVGVGAYWLLHSAGTAISHIDEE